MHPVSHSRAQRFIERIAANVQLLRVKKGLTQERLAEFAELAPRSIQRLERAQQDVSVSVLVAVADALEVQISLLFRPAKLAPAKPGRPSRASPRPKAGKASTTR